MTIDSIKMCLGVPGKIIEINDNTATIDYDIEKRTVKLLNQDFKIGDYVIIQANIAVLKVEKKEALEALELYKKNSN